MSEITPLTTTNTSALPTEVDSDFLRHIQSEYDSDRLPLFIESGEEAPDNAPPRADIAIVLTPPADLSMEDLTFILGVLQQESSEELLKYSSETIKQDERQMKALQAERIKQLEEFLHRSEKAAKAGRVNKIMGWITVAVTAVAAAALIATGVGAAAGVALIAVVVITALPMISQETGGWLEKGVTDMFREMGVKNPELAAMIAIEVTVLVAGLAVGGGVAWAAKAGKLGATAAKGGKMVNAADKGADMGKAASVADKGTDAGKVASVADKGTDAGKVASVADKGADVGKAAHGARAMEEGADMSKTVRRMTNLGNRFNQGVQGMQGADAAIGVYGATQNYKAKMAQADAEETMAYVAQLQMLMQDQMDRVRELQEKAQENMSMVIAILGSFNDAKTAIYRNIVI